MLNINIISTIFIDILIISTDILEKSPDSPVQEGGFDSDNSVISSTGKFLQISDAGGEGLTGKMFRGYQLILPKGPDLLIHSCAPWMNKECSDDIHGPWYQLLYGTATKISQNHP